MNIILCVTLFVLLGFCKQAIPCAQQIGLSTVDPVEQAIQSSSYIVPVLQGKIVKANLPADLKEQADEVVVNAEEQIQACEDSLKETRIIFVYKICVNTVFRAAIAQIDALENQAKAQTEVSSTYSY